MSESEYWARRRANEANSHSRDANYAGPRDGYHPTHNTPAPAPVSAEPLEPAQDDVMGLSGNIIILPKSEKERLKKEREKPAHSAETMEPEFITKAFNAGRDWAIGQRERDSGLIQAADAKREEAAADALRRLQSTEQERDAAQDQCASAERDLNKAWKRVADLEQEKGTR